MENTHLERQRSTMSRAEDMLQKEYALLLEAENAPKKTSMIAAVTKVSKRLQEYERLMHDLRDDDKQLKVVFERNNKLLDIRDKVMKMGYRITAPDLHTNGIRKLDLKAKVTEIGKQIAAPDLHNKDLRKPRLQI